MQRAGEAMKQIHGKLTVEKVDETMYVMYIIVPMPPFVMRCYCRCRDSHKCRNRDSLREQNALSEEIVSAITSNHIGEPLDEEELDEELEALQQEALDKKMLESGTVPVSDIHKLPSVANPDSTVFPPLMCITSIS